jgi:GT2 family glycosyltransferase
MESVLASRFRDFELVVVDQSRDRASEALVATLAERDPRIRRVADAGTGAARARNIGIAQTFGDIVVFTDDDCEPEPNWLGTLVEALQADSAAGIAFGAVIPAAHDPAHGFIVGFQPTRRARLTGRLAKLRDAGISANVAVRRKALCSTGGFDEMLGPGSYFPCAEDFDLTYRTLSGGYALLHVPEARLEHHGLRDWKSGSTLIMRTYVAIGAAYMKHLRARDVVGGVLLLQELGLAVLNIVKHAARLQGPFGFGRLKGLVTGIWRSFELDIELGRVVYRAPVREIDGECPVPYGLRASPNSKRSN